MAAAEDQSLANRRPKQEPGNGAATPITPIANTGLAEAIMNGGRIYQLMVDSVKDYAIFAQVSCDSICAGELAHCGGFDGGRLDAATRLPQRCDVIDVHIEA